MSSALPTESLCITAIAKSSVAVLVATDGKASLGKATRTLASLPPVCTPQRIVDEAVPVSIRATKQFQGLWAPLSVRSSRLLRLDVRRWQKLAACRRAG